MNGASITKTAMPPHYELWRERLIPTAPGFIVCAMFTGGYLHKAERLAASLNALNLSYALFQVPRVHRSISVNGGDDDRFSKPRFIASALGHYGCPVLYVDADCVFHEQPVLIERLRKHDVDFGVYNWLADTMNDAWLPVADGKSSADGNPPLWAFSFSIDMYSTTQLSCSGCTQYWSTSAAASLLLQTWHEAIIKFPKAPDDHCLDHAFNFAMHEKKTPVRHFWLPKEYARYAHWIYVRPLIDHPEMPTGPSLRHFEDIEISRRINIMDVIVDAEKARPFSRRCIVDAPNKCLLMPTPAGQYAPLHSTMPPIFADLGAVTTDRTSPAAGAGGGPAFGRPGLDIAMRKPQKVCESLFFAIQRPSAGRFFS